MVSTLQRFQVTSNDATKKLSGRFYGADADRPVMKAIHTQINPFGRSPRLDLLLAGNQIQPRIHDAIITVISRQTTVRFHIFVKNHCHLRPNRIIHRWNRNAAWRGDIAVMRKGIVEELVNMRGGDAKLADFAVKRFTDEMKQGPQFYIPKRLVFYK